MYVAQQTIYNMVKESQLFYEKHDQDLHGSFTKGGPFYLPIALTSMILHHANIILSHFRERKENWNVFKRVYKWKRGLSYH